METLNSIFLFWFSSAWIAFFVFLIMYDDGAKAFALAPVWPLVVLKLAYRELRDL